MKNTCLKETFLKANGLSDMDCSIESVAGDGSARLFSRIMIKGGNSFIFMENPPKTEFLKKENIAYLMIGKHMISKSIPLPRILEHDLNTGCFILEDMGNVNLQDKVSSVKNRTAIYENVIENLIKLQTEGIEGFNTDWCCQTPVYDAELMREKEANYFRDAFLRDYIKTDIDLSSLDNAFEHIISKADKADKNFLLHRDFQSRNIMIRDKGIAILDWQGARPGPLAYDLASLLFDPYVDLPMDERNHLKGVYERLLKKKNLKKYESFKKYFYYVAAMRILQALGAYSFLSLKQGKTYFEKYIPAALNSLSFLLEEISHRDLRVLAGIVNDAAETL